MFIEISTIEPKEEEMTKYSLRVANEVIETKQKAPFQIFFRTLSDQPCWLPKNDSRIRKSKYGGHYIFTSRDFGHVWKFLLPPWGEEKK